MPHVIVIISSRPAMQDEITGPIQQNIPAVVAEKPHQILSGVALQAKAATGLDFATMDIIEK